MLSDVTGMLCDGAKANCALKISTCVNTAFQCAFMALHNEVVKASDGIVETDPEKTIENFIRLGNEGSPIMDALVLDIMMNKENKHAIG
jgi:L-cysteine desulfidase